jgi:trehalose 6-phosphate phosphatase
MTSTAASTLSPPPVGLLRGASLFLDFDGTLVDLAERPDAVQVTNTLRDLLAALCVRLDGRVAIVTGRAADGLAALFDRPPFAVAGSHGSELRWPDGRRRDQGRPDALDEAVAELEQLRKRHPALLVEDKPFGAAIHYRAEPEAEAACRDLATRLAARTGLPLLPGKMVFELRLAGIDKGTAVEALMADGSLAGTRPVFIGDDITDEAGFEAAARLGGTGILVGPQRETAASFHLPEVAAVLRWLEMEARATP